MSDCNHEYAHFANMGSMCTKCFFTRSGLDMSKEVQKKIDKFNGEEVKSFTDIINDEVFQKWCLETLGDNTLGFLSVYEILHKTREAINENYLKLKSDFSIEYGVNSGDIYYKLYKDTAMSTSFLALYKKSSYNNQEVEALTAALDFIRMEELKKPDPDGWIETTDKPNLGSSTVIEIKTISKGCYTGPVGSFNWDCGASGYEVISYRVIK